MRPGLTIQSTPPVPTRPGSPLSDRKNHGIVGGSGSLPGGCLYNSFTLRDHVGFASDVFGEPDPTQDVSRDRQIMISPHAV